MVIQKELRTVSAMRTKAFLLEGFPGYIRLRTVNEFMSKCRRAHMGELVTELLFEEQEWRQLIIIAEIRERQQIEAIMDGITQ